MTGINNVGIFIISMVVFFVITGVTWVRVDIERNISTTGKSSDLILTTEHPSTMNVVIIVCGPRFNEAIQTMKSILMFSGSNIQFIIFVDEENKPLFKDTGLFPDYIMKKFTLTIYDITLPKEHSLEEWPNNIKPCCTQRIYLPDVLTDVERLIYADTDLRFLVPLEEVWSLFDMFNTVQIAGLTWHNEDGRAPTYVQEKLNFPLFKPYGLNSGFVLMDLSRMRAANWTEKMSKYFSQYKNDLLYGDQDLFNVYFSYEPETLFKVDCKYNFHVCYCMNKNVLSCLTAVQDGVSIVHGIMSTFRTNVSGFLGFYTVNQFFEKFNLTQAFDVQLEELLMKLSNLTEKEEKCLSYMDTLTKRLRETKHQLGYLPK